MPLEHRGYAAYLSCDGREIEQYRVKVENDETISCYVPGDRGKEYRVHWLDSKPPTHLSVEVRSDGRRIGVVSHMKGASSKGTHSGLRVPLDCSSDFLHVPDGDDALPAAYSEEIGTIEIRLRRVRDFMAVPFVPKPRQAAGPSRDRPRGSTSARASNSRLSTISARSTSSNLQKENQARSTVLRPILIDDKPYVIFRFLYRPTGILEANGIKPADSKPPKQASSSSMSRQKRKPVGEAVIGSATASTRRRPYKRQRCISEENEQDNGIPDVANTPEHDRKPNKCDNDCIVEEVNHAGGHENFSEQPHEVQVQPSSQSPATHGRDDIMAVDDEIEEERIVEAHLSSHNGFCFLGEVDTSPTCVEEEAVPDVLKREASPDNFSIPWRPPTYGEDAKPDPEGSEEEGDDLEIHLTSRNQHIIFGNRVDMSVRQEKKQQQRLVKREDSKSPGLEHPGNGEVPSHPVKLEEEEDVVVEVHISSKDIRVASARVRAEGARVPKAEPQ